MSWKSYQDRREGIKSIRVCAQLRITEKDSGLISDFGIPMQWEVWWNAIEDLIQELRDSKAKNLSLFLIVARYYRYYSSSSHVHIPGHQEEEDKGRIKVSVSRSCPKNLWVLMAKSLSFVSCGPTPPPPVAREPGKYFQLSTLLPLARSGSSW